ncbi:MAG: sulfite reductase (NADPH) hemoprotein beta-component [Halothiobacillaceae bacterium]|nr:MAG: sulfite reductase (NADPH) hemoprotein beta-component [Halothiobacillaceae bacterium]
MYIYDEYDQRLVDERVAQFRDQTERFLAGALGEDEFRALRLMNGLYVQTHAPMLRVAIPYGLLASRQLRMLAHIARHYDRGYGHFTTRQNIQYNWPDLAKVPEIVALLASVQMQSIQTSGNCIRNVTSDHLAGVAADEIEDPRPYCEMIRHWSTLHPEFAYLPRKFKIAVSGAARDRAATQVHDIGLHLVRHPESGVVGFEVLVGGGLGRTPVLGQTIRTYLEKKDLFSYLEAILRTYNRLGRRDNIYKARIKILVKSMGIDAFRQLVEAEWSHLKNGELDLTEREIERVKAFFQPPPYDMAAANSSQFAEQLQRDSRFARWAKHNLVDHKIAGYKAVFISLKAPSSPPGDITAEQLEAVAAAADTFSFGEARATHNQNLLLADVRQDELYPLWQALEQHNLATPNIGTLTDMICCPGLDFCSLANASSISIAADLNSRFDDLDYLYDLGELRVNISGCMNACAHQDVGHIGILGVDKKGEEWYQITLGGSSSNDASLGDRLGPAVAKDKLVDTIEVLIHTYVEQRYDGERFLDTYRRIGMAPFKERIYADH